MSSVYRGATIGRERERSLQCNGGVKDHNSRAGEDCALSLPPSNTLHNSRFQSGRCPQIGRELKYPMEEYLTSILSSNMAIINSLFLN